MTEQVAGRFLTAKWLRLAMINYEVDPGILRSRVPTGTELDTWDGRCFISVVGFQFLNTRVFGISVPFHSNFLELNLRYYVRRTVKGQVSRGVVFVKELVPRFAIAFMAKVIYNENYQAVPMSNMDSGHRVEYSWRYRGRDSQMGLSIEGKPYQPTQDSEESFITEHYWGYVTQRDGTTVEYKVEHPPWRVWRGFDPNFDCDGVSLYGAEFEHSFRNAPSSCFLAEGSEIIVRRGVKI
jgi:uncharacterized protein